MTEWPKVLDYRSLWVIPALVRIRLFLILVFKEDKKKKKIVKIQNKILKPFHYTNRNKTIRGVRFRPSIYHFIYYFTFLIAILLIIIMFYFIVIKFEWYCCNEFLTYLTETLEKLNKLNTFNGLYVHTPAECCGNDRLDWVPNLTLQFRVDEANAIDRNILYKNLCNDSRQAREYYEANIAELDNINFGDSEAIKTKARANYKYHYDRNIYYLKNFYMEDLLTLKNDAQIAQNGYIESLTRRCQNSFQIPSLNSSEPLKNYLEIYSKITSPSLKDCAGAGSDKNYSELVSKLNLSVSQQVNSKIYYPTHLSLSKAIFMGIFGTVLGVT